MGTGNEVIMGQFQHALEINKVDFGAIKKEAIQAEVQSLISARNFLRDMKTLNTLQMTLSEVPLERKVIVQMPQRQLTEDLRSQLESMVQELFADEPEERVSVQEEVVLSDDHRELIRDRLAEMRGQRMQAFRANEAAANLQAMGLDLDQIAEDDVDFEDLLGRIGQRLTELDKEWEKIINDEAVAKTQEPTKADDSRAVFQKFFRAPQTWLSAESDFEDRSASNKDYSQAKAQVNRILDDLQRFLNTVATERDREKTRKSDEKADRHQEGYELRMDILRDEIKNNLMLAELVRFQEMVSGFINQNPGMQLVELELDPESGAVSGVQMGSISGGSGSVHSTSMS